MIGFALTLMLDEEACYNYLVEALHSNGLDCPLGHPLPKDQAPHRRVRAPVMDYRCRQCGKVFNALVAPFGAKLSTDRVASFRF
jgi:hypothetical protein